MNDKDNDRYKHLTQIPMQGNHEKPGPAYLAWEAINSANKQIKLLLSRKGDNSLAALIKKADAGQKQAIEGHIKVLKETFQESAEKMAKELYALVFKEKERLNKYSNLAALGKDYAKLFKYGDAIQRASHPFIDSAMNNRRCIYANGNAISNGAMVQLIEDIDAVGLNYPSVKMVLAP